MTNDQIHLYVYRGLNGKKKDIKEKKVYVVRDEARYFSEALGFSPPSAQVNPALHTTASGNCEKQWHY